MDDSWPNLYNDPYAVKRIQKSVELANVKKGMSVLDIGCHKGELENLLPKGVFYYGMDNLLGHEIDGGFIPIRKFDRVFCLETLEHLKYPIKTLKSINDALLPDGIVLISLPNEATLFHRIRSFLGTVDAEAFQECGKHIHLANLRQSTEFLEKQFLILRRLQYINPQATGSRQSWLGKLMRLLPDNFWQFLADRFPSLLARGFIFVCKLP